MASDPEKDAVIGSSDPFQVFLDPYEEPLNMPSWRKWTVISVLSAGSLCATCLSSVSSFTTGGASFEFHISSLVSTLALSLFVAGLGLGPLFVGPLSEIYGRNIVYRASYGLLFVFSWPVMFAPNPAVYFLFRFITGLCSSAFLSVVGGSAADMFSNEQIGSAMALYTITPFLGPILGPLMGGFINQNLEWRWTYRIMTIWIFVEFLLVLFVVPETYVPILLKRKAARLRASTGISEHWAPLEKRTTTVLQTIAVSCYTPLKLMIFDQMAFLLNLWTALILGILYLSFEAFPIIFAKHGFDMQQTGLTFLGLGIGELIACASTPWWNRQVARSALKHGGKAPPEVRLYMGQVGGIIVPISLFWIAFTSYSHVHWIVPIIASIPLGTGLYLVFNSVFTYLVVAYRPIAASAMAANSAVRSSFAAGFPLFAGAMYAKLGTVGATGLLAGLTMVMAPLPFVFHRYGAHLRRNSPFAAT